MYTDPCLGPSGVGVLDARGNLTQNARDAFTDQVIALMLSGNENGKGAKVSSLLGIAFPPPSGILLPDPDKILVGKGTTSDLFRFSPSPFAFLSSPVLKDPNGDYQKIIVDKLYQPLMQTMNVKGNAVAPPILDYSGILPPDISIKLSLPDIPKISLAVPNLLLLKALGLDLGDIPDFIVKLGLIIPQPNFPSLPPLPQLGVFSYEFSIFLDLFLGLMQIPIQLLPQLLLKFTPPQLLAPSPPKMFELVLDLFLDLLLKLLAKVGLLTIMPKLLASTLIVMVQQAVAAMVPLIISQIVGTGLIAKSAGSVLGLV